MTRHESQTVNVLSQNILLDITRTKEKRMLSQDDRIEAIADMMNVYPGSLDVVGIQEAHQSKRQHNGQVLAELCGHGPGFWVNHNRKVHPDAKKGRAGEHVGLFGAMVDHAQVAELGDNRRAVKTDIAGVAFVTIHLRAGPDARNLRGEQAARLIRALDAYEDAIVFGDFNEPPIPLAARARRQFKQAGFTSVFTLTGQPQPGTFPTDAYRGITGCERTWQLDDILIRGPRVRALAAGVLERTVMNNTDTGMPDEATDHRGVWAQLEIK